MKLAFFIYVYYHTHRGNGINEKEVVHWNKIKKQRLLYLVEI